jgi:RNA polymerase sigma factor (sigma-70 family)
MIDSPKPSFAEVFAYSEKQVEHYIRKFARHLPFEQKEEIAQNAAIRTWKAYEKLEADKGWRSFMQTHAMGAVKDYLKLGNGNIEDGVVSDDALDGLKTRVEIFTKDGTAIENVEVIAGMFGIHSESELDEESFKPNWDLLSRMCGLDEDLHILCKVLLGFTQEEIAEQMGSDISEARSRERISQRVIYLINKFDSPEFLNNPWINQTIFALGLCSHYLMPELDNGRGWDEKAFNLADINSFRNVQQHYRPSFFDLGIFSEADKTEWRAKTSAALVRQT